MRVQLRDILLHLEKQKEEEKKRKELDRELLWYAQTDMQYDSDDCGE